MGRCVALIVAAGRGSRMGGPMPKQWLDLAGRPVLRHSLDVFSSHPSIAAVRVVIHPDDRALLEKTAAGLSIGEPIAGGATRQDSVRLGLEAVADDKPDLVLIHDGARPFVDAATIDRVITALAVHPGAIPAQPVHDTLKRVNGTVIEMTVPRAGLWRAQTPQGFRFADILKAHRAAAGQELTDDAAVLEHAGLDVAIVPGSEDNIKITTGEDLERATERLMIHGETRVGTGFDVHHFVPGDHVMIGGVRVPHDRSLEGHSDADVALHALTDAILGAVAAGDIGRHFPPSDPQWKGAASSKFLAHAASLAAKAGATIVHVDVTVICEKPKVSPHAAAMTTSIANILGIEEGRVSVKGTTTDKLGFTGRGEGIAAQAVATVRIISPRGV
ncbi:MAG TPA: bifunctional 2-C-methyl-D-erythritol 4-phosphate cytidylyltransferase/2-C-methyl-D-erythritol 2,4-cyclodiphosphate synthase [Magnetospirillaceae bacterium]